MSLTSLRPMSSSFVDMFVDMWLPRVGQLTGRARTWASTDARIPGSTKLRTSLRTDARICDVDAWLGAARVRDDDAGHPLTHPVGLLGPEPAGQVGRCERTPPSPDPLRPGEGDLRKDHLRLVSDQEPQGRGGG